MMYSIFSSKEELSSVVEDYAVSFYQDNIKFDMIKSIVEEKYNLKISETKDQNKIKDIESVSRSVCNILLRRNDQRLYLVSGFQKWSYRKSLQKTY